MAPDIAHGDLAWSSQGLPPSEAVRYWQSWACDTLASMRIDVPDAGGFAAHWRSRRVGPLRLIELGATSQRVVHSGQRTRNDQSTFQLLYCANAPISARIAGQDFRIEAGEFVLVDNAQPYDMRMQAHRAIDVIVPGTWLERWIPDPRSCAGRPYSATSQWGLPLGSLLTAMASEIESAALPRAVIADQLGALLALAVGRNEVALSTHKGKLVQRARQLIEERHGEPELDPGEIARTMGISKRYLHALLSESGATFLRVLGRVRLDRASEILADARFDGRQIAEIAWQCGYSDHSYFARVFRRRYGMGPREWRAARRG